MPTLNLTGRSPALSPPQKDAPPTRDQLRVYAEKALNRFLQMKREMKAKFDAAQTFSANENHWENADHFDPHTAASLTVRRTLRSRSRYEVIENNPYLKGTLLTIANDFVGTGPKLQISDKKLSNNARTEIEERNAEWAEAICMRDKIWRMKMAKPTDGESFAIPFVNRNRRFPYPIALDFYILETDRISSETVRSTDVNAKIGEIDGIRFDAYEQPVQYHVLYRHPGGSALNVFTPNEASDGRWIDSRYVIHWFRRDRGWLRGIPELTPSLPLCALLRRYTLSIVRHAEVLADFTVLLETQNPASPNPIMKDAMGNWVEDPFDLWPIDMGMMTNLPYGYTAKQLESVPLGTQYDAFVGALLREIMRPILAPYNIVAGTSKDSNMASSVLDVHIYRGGQMAERNSCESTVLDHMNLFWWNEAIRTKDYFSSKTKKEIEIAGYGEKLPKHRYRWDRIGIDHTDPQKAAEALKIMHDKRFITDADIQESWFNRDVNSWRQEVEEDEEFRAKLEPVNPEDRVPDPAPEPGAAPKPKAKKPKTKSKS